MTKLNETKYPGVYKNPFLERLRGDHSLRMGEQVATELEPIEMISKEAFDIAINVSKNRGFDNHSFWEKVFCVAESVIFDAAVIAEYTNARITGVSMVYMCPILGEAFRKQAEKMNIRTGIVLGVGVIKLEKLLHEFDPIE